MMDPIALTMIEKYGGDFGRERLFSMFGMAIFSPITGILIDYYSKQLGYTDYSAAFYAYDALLVISAITVFLMPLGEKLPSDSVFRDLLNLLKMPHVICFIFFLFVLGNFWGFIESFLFLYLKELGAPNYLLGITITGKEDLKFFLSGFNLLSFSWNRQQHSFPLHCRENHENLWTRQPHCHLIPCALVPPRGLLIHWKRLVVLPLWGNGGFVMSPHVGCGRHLLLAPRPEKSSRHLDWSIGNGALLAGSRKWIFHRRLFDCSSWHERSLQIHGNGGNNWRFRIQIHPSDLAQKVRFGEFWNI